MVIDFICVYFSYSNLYDSRCFQAMHINTVADILQTTISNVFFVWNFLNCEWKDKNLFLGV